MNLTQVTVLPGVFCSWFYPLKGTTMASYLLLCLPPCIKLNYSIFHFCWPSLCWDTQWYVISGTTCSISKASCQVLDDLLCPLPFPSHPQSHDALDFVTGLLNSQGKSHSQHCWPIQINFCIWVCPSDDWPCELAGISLDIVGQVPQFVSQVWQNFC